MSGGSFSSADPLDRVAEILADACERGTTSEVREAIQALWATRNPDAQVALHHVLQEGDEFVKLEAAASLVAADDPQGLSAAVDFLQREDQAGKDDEVHNLQVAISEGVRDPGRADLLGALLTSRDAGTRRAASFALGHMSSRAAIPYLATALNDSDEEVQYNAVVGLATLNRDSQHAPSRPEFAANASAYLTFWRRWASRNHSAMRHEMTLGTPPDALCVLALETKGDAPTSCFWRS